MTVDSPGVTCLAFVCCIQVQYSLLYRRPETNGVLEACRENNVTLVAYSPMCQGLLTGGHWLKVLAVFYRQADG